MPKNWTPESNPAPGLKTLAQRSALLAKVREGFDKKAEDFAGRLVAGKINLETWERYMRREIRAMHTAALIISRGGDPKAITPDDIAGLNKAIKGQYVYLRRFRDQIGVSAQRAEAGKGEFFSERYIATRSKLYGGAAGATFYQTFAYGLLPRVPRDGSTQCKTNCKCELEFRQSRQPEVIHVFWIVDHAAENCPDCLELETKWKPYILRLPEGLSAQNWVMCLPRMQMDNIALGGSARNGLARLAVW